MIRALLAVVVGVGLASPVPAACRLALALGLDVSGSVDAREYRLQIDGLAAALSHPQVRAALFALPDVPVDLAVFEWSAPEYQSLLIDWTRVAGPADLAAIVARLRQTTRRADAPTGTGLGTAMETGARLLDARRQCWARTLDLSGDGKHNMGPHPKDVRARLAQDGLTINALVIGADAPASGDLRQAEIGELSSYFNAWVITGPGAFVETALGFQDYEAAMIRKLTRELDTLILSDIR